MEEKIKKLHLVHENWHELAPHQRTEHIMGLGNLATSTLINLSINPDISILVSEPEYLHSERNKYAYTYKHKGDYWKILDHNLPPDRYHYYLLAEDGTVGYVESNFKARKHVDGMDNLLFDLHHPFTGINPVHEDVDRRVLYAVFRELHTVALEGLKKAA